MKKINNEIYMILCQKPKNQFLVLIKINLKIKFLINLIKFKLKNLI